MEERTLIVSRKKLFLNVHFILRFLAAIMSLLIVMLWAVAGFPAGYENFDTQILFAHAAPSYTVLLCGLIIGYFLRVDPPKKLMILWESMGIGIFTTMGSLQIAHMMVESGAAMRIDTFVLAFLHIASGIVFAIDIIIINKTTESK